MARCLAIAAAPAASLTGARWRRPARSSDPKPVATTSDGRPVEGLTHTARTSSVIGYGRTELPTRGAVDALALAAYADSPAARAEPRQPPSIDLLRRAKEAARPPWVA